MWGKTWVGRRIRGAGERGTGGTDLGHFLGIPPSCLTSVCTSPHVEDRNKGFPSRRHGETSEIRSKLTPGATSACYAQTPAVPPVTSRCVCGPRSEHQDMSSVASHTHVCMPLVKLRLLCLRRLPFRKCLSPVEGDGPFCSVPPSRIAEQRYDCPVWLSYACGS